jgi:hypothetical protein
MIKTYNIVLTSKNYNTVIPLIMPCHMQWKCCFMRGMVSFERNNSVSNNKIVSNCQNQDTKSEGKTNK